jgi:hypothetical protein
MPRSRSALVLAIALLASLPTSASDEKSKPVPLFSGNDLLEVTITAPFSTIMWERPSDEDVQGQLSYYDLDQEEAVLDIGIRTRGHFRRQREVCPFAPLRLNFRKTKGTLFAKSDKLKLVTHCKSGSPRYTQALLKEYVAYRILNSLTDASFRVRLLRVKYVESESGEIVDHNYAFLIEHRDQLAKRIGLKVDKSESTTASAIDGVHTNLVSMFQYLIGNTDFSPIKGMPDQPCCHNYVLFGDDNGPALSIPYDFDMTGIVSAPHSAPNPRFQLRSVRDRLYRGRCENNHHLEASIRIFQEHRQDLEEILRSTPGLSKNSVRKLKKYMSSFYDLIDSPGSVEKRLVMNCLG